MTESRQRKLLPIDLLGGCFLAACISAFIWLTIPRGDGVSTEIADLTQTVQRAKRDFAHYRNARNRQRSLLANRRGALAAGGQLPDEAPIERYFQTLSTLAAQHRLRVRSHHPVSPRHYPGLLELRYAYELSGAIPDIVRFFRSVEQTDFWADISFLKVARGTGALDAGASERIASLTISIFSALPVKVDSDEG